MTRISRSTRRLIAFLIWGAGIILFVALAMWNLASSRKDAENHLISEAGRAAAQIAGLLSVSGAKVDQEAIRIIARAAMDDERLYAIRIQMKDGFAEGLRRNYLWEPIPWDDELSENCVQGMNPIRHGAKIEGRVEVWLSPRLSVEEDSLLEARERLRFAITAGLWTVALFLLLWHWGGLRHFRNILSRAPAFTGHVKGETAEKIVLGLGDHETKKKASADKKQDIAPRYVDMRLGREFQKSNPNAWLVTAGMFRQTFSRAPALIGRLYAEGELAALCHLGRMLEQAAPCIGAVPLVRAAHAMQLAINDPECKTRALPVENCAKILEETLAALGGKGLISSPNAPTGCDANPDNDIDDTPATDKSEQAPEPEKQES